MAETVGECTVTYIYEIGNTVPDNTVCYNTFAYINDEGKPGSNGCGGYFGGVLGWNEKGNRTSDPVYAIQPKSGNPNCFMPPGKEGDRPLAQDELPGGVKVPAAQCPTAVSRRELFGPTTGCTVGTSIWTFGVGLAVAPALCLGPCGSLAWGLDKGCEKIAGPPTLKPRLLLHARAADPAPDPCAGTQSAAIACPALRNQLLTLHQCAGADGALEGEVVHPPGAGGVITT
ncbi:MAG: hypothetical protein Q9170_006532 [Blastenia crenularia]